MSHRTNNLDFPQRRPTPGPRHSKRARALIAALLLASVGLVACEGDDETSGVRPQTTADDCDQSCVDGAAVRALRQTIKLVYNLTLQGRVVGEHDATTPCPLGGQARVFGTAFSNPEQGTTDVDLTYELDGCVNYEKDDEADRNYKVTLSGTIRQVGKIAVQPSFTTALSIKSDAVSFSGTVLEPPVDYEEPSCPLVFQQDGNRLFGTICGRDAASTL